MEIGKGVGFNKLLLSYGLENTFNRRTEFLKNGKKRVYDVCSSYSFLKAMTCYNFFTFRFIGSSYYYYINGTLNESRKRHCFFVYRKRFLYLRKKANL